MSAGIEVNPSDRGRVWVFAVDVEPEKLDAFKARGDSWPVQEALGADTLDPGHVEVFPVSDLEGLGLAAYLADGYGIPGDQLADTRDRLDARKGAVMVLSARAFGGTGQTFTPRAPLRLLASLSEERPPVAFEPLPSAAATGTVSGDDTGPILRSRRNWFAPLIVFGVAVAVAAIVLLVVS